MLTTEVIDLSHHQTIPQDLSGAKEAGVIGVIHKMTEGNSFIDDKAKARKFLCDEAELRWGIYHFLRPGDMQAQVDFFLHTADDNGCFDGKTLVALDYEDAGVSLADLDEALIYLAKQTSRSPVLYAGGVLKDKGGADAQPGLNIFRLWLSQFANAAT